MKAFKRNSNRNDWIRGHRKSVTGSGIISGVIIAVMFVIWTWRRYYEPKLETPFYK